MTEGDPADPLRSVARIPCPPGFTAWLIGAPELPSGALGLTGDLGGTTDLPPAGQTTDGGPWPYRLGELRPAVTRVAGTAIDGLPPQPGDLHDPLARRITTGVLHELVGGPSLARQVTSIVAARRTVWGDDLLSRLMLQGRPTLELATANVALLHATAEAGAALITGSVRVLLRSPVAWRRLCADPALASNAARSSLRHLGVDVGVVRRARHDLTIGGHHIVAGDFVVTPARPAGPAPAAGLSSVRADAVQQLALLQLTTTLELLASRLPSLHRAAASSHR